MPNSTEAQSPNLSLEESIQRLKAEILSQDWRLSEKRTELLAAAFDCLKLRFTNRKTAFAILVMATNVLVYIQKKGDQQIAGTVDFLKEAMAHIVTFYEDPALDPEKDKKVFNALYRRFGMLKDKIQADQRSASKPELTPPSIPTAQRETEQLIRETASQTLPLLQEQPKEEANSQEKLQQQSFSGSGNLVLLEGIHKMDRQSVDNLVRELKDSLQRAEEVGTTIRQLLVELLASRQMPLPTMESILLNTAGQTTIAASGEAVESSPLTAEQQPSPEACEECSLLLLQIGDATIAVEEKFLAARRPIAPERRQYYLKHNTVPLKDFKRFLHSLAGQFKGCLSSLKDGKLRTLSLPVVVPRGLRLPDKLGELEQEALVLCNGNWCGVLFCSPAGNGRAVMVAKRQLNDGDLYRIAYTKEGERFSLLNTVELLKREGHMVVVP